VYQTTEGFPCDQCVRLGIQCLFNKGFSEKTFSPPGTKRGIFDALARISYSRERLDTKVLSDPSEESQEENEGHSVGMDDGNEDYWEDSSSESSVAHIDPLDKRNESTSTLRSSRLPTIFKSKSDCNLGQAFRAQTTVVASRRSLGDFPRPQPLAVGPHGHSSAPLALASTNALSQSVPISIRTTRRKMLASELSESLRRNLLWQRKHRNRSTHITTDIKRRHSSNDLAHSKGVSEGLLGNYGFCPGDAALRPPEPASPIDIACDTVEILYPIDVMNILQERSEKIAAVLRPIPWVSCLSGFDTVAPEMKFLSEDDKNFFTGISCLYIANIFNLRYIGTRQIAWLESTEPTAERLVDALLLSFAHLP
jgi:hypothetical protein